MLNCWVTVQPKKGNLSLRPFATGEMNMSSGKKGCYRLDPFFVGLLDNNRFSQLYEDLLIKPPNVELLVIVQPKEGNLLLRPFAARKINMSSGKKGLLSIRTFLIGLLDNNRSAQLYEGLLIKPPDVELLVIVQPKKGNLLLRPFAAGKINMSSGKKGLLSIRTFLIGLLNNNRFA